MLGWTILKQLIPFFKEMIIGKGSYSQALRYDQRRLVAFIAVMASFALNVVFLSSVTSGLLDRPRAPERVFDVHALVDTNRRLEQQISNKDQELLYCRRHENQFEPRANNWSRGSYFQNELGHLYHSGDALP